MLVRIGVKTFGSDLINQVGTGSRTHCLLGQRPSKRRMSWSLTGVNAVIRQSVGRMTDGCSDSAVESRRRVGFGFFNSINRVCYRQCWILWLRGTQSIGLHVVTLKFVQEFIPISSSRKDDFGVSCEQAVHIDDAAHFLTCRSGFNLLRWPRLVASIM